MSNFPLGHALSSSNFGRGSVGDEPVARNRIAANAVSALVIVLLIVNPARDLTQICTLLALAVVLWLGSRVKPRR
jgi:hypothetical protein